VYDRDGTLIASFVQESMIRQFPKDNGGKATPRTAM
jgi:acyl-CoA thioesterase